MSEPFIAEIQMWGCSYAPRGWTDCSGQILSIAEFTALFSLIGTVYGGDGRTTMGVPNLKGRAPMHAGTGPGLSAHNLGEFGGVDLVTLSADQLPRHKHSINVNNSGATTASPENQVLGKGSKASGPPAGRAIKEYADFDAANVTTMASQMISSSGASGGHLNEQPFMSVRFCMALTGIYPSRN